jgi:hypothetical protein
MYNVVEHVSKFEQGKWNIRTNRGKGKAKNKMAMVVEFTWVSPFFPPTSFLSLSPFRSCHHQRRLLSLINQPVKGVRYNNQSNGF